MSKGYKLADGSLSTDYEVGDEFVVNSRVDEQAGFSKGSIINFYRDDYSVQPLFNLIKGDCNFNNCHGNKGAFVWWFCLTPTPETKRKVQARKSKFTINAGDYIDSREFSCEECERFCELAVECGFPMSECEFDRWYGVYKYIGIGQLTRTPQVWFEDSWYYAGKRWSKNITTQFREFLNKEKGMSQENNIKAAELICDKITKRSTNHAID